jgi:hypothetical protein
VGSTPALPTIYVDATLLVAEHCAQDLCALTHNPAAAPPPPAPPAAAAAAAAADYRIRMPLSVNQQHSDVLTKFIKARFRVQGQWAYYLNQHGRNFVFANTSYQMNPPPQWAQQCCMCEGKPAGHSQFTNQELVNGVQVEEEVMFAASPDSAFFQHWRDRTALMLTQAQHLLSPKTKFVAAPPSDDTVAKHWQLIRNVTAERLIPPSVVNARKFIYSCDTPLLHPYLVQHMSENMLGAASINPQGVPWDQRKVVLLIGRNNDAGVHNGHERRWNNYGQCKPKIEALLQQRGQGEQLVEWSLSNFASLQDIMRFWNTQVRVKVMLKQCVVCVECRSVFEAGVRLDQAREQLGIMQAVLAHGSGSQYIRHSSLDGGAIMACAC